MGLTHTTMTHALRPPRQYLSPLSSKLIVRIALGAFAGGALLQAAGTAPPLATPNFRQYCFGCHGKATASAGINLEQLTSQPSFGEYFQHWQRVATALEQKRMPPPKLPQPSEADRGHAVAWIRSSLRDYAEKHAGDPGRVTVRRLTSGEYAYSIHDLTGLDLKFDRDFASDSVGGEGFTNFGDVQFMADANLERYLEAARRVADHAVIGAGPLTFYDDAGKSGFELSAINRIQSIYRANGFRANSGEGGKPYGLDRYSKVFYVCWRYKHRAALGESRATLDQIATREGVTPRFARYIRSVLEQPSPTYPTSDVVAKFRSLPVPTGRDRARSLAAGKAGSEDVMRAVVDWPRWLLAAGEVAKGGEGDERALVINEAVLQPAPKHHLKFVLRTRGKKSSNVYLSVVPANANARDKPMVIWRNGSIRIFSKDRALSAAKPIEKLLDPATVARLGIGRRPEGLPADVPFGEHDFAGSAPLSFEVPTTEGGFGAELQIDAELISGPAGDAVLRCTIADNEDVSKGRPSWALLGNPANPRVQVWKSNVLEFAARLPQNSQGEPTPSDKDPIPLPFDNTYNQPERDQFHSKAKYYRTDRFLTENVLDDATRLRLDQAWNDLLASFEYHDIILRFTAEKFHLDSLKNRRIADMDTASIQALPEEPRKYVRALRAEYDAVRKAQLAAQPGHVEDSLRFASRAWRRPLTAAEKDRLRAFYVRSTEEGKLDHSKAVESLLARVLVSPSFLYRLEEPSETAGVRALSDWEMASRLSYFLWSSIPDQELRRAATAHELSNPQQLQKQVKRMLADEKARRFSTEFFGQWLGFYRFDQHRGVDTTRYPEFTDDVRAGMYDEAVSFFEHVIRKDRPVDEILTANYTFLNKPLAKHYGVKKEIQSAHGSELVENAHEFQRGGMLRLGAVLTATSAPLRTSPVKRGDWVLRRILGTPTPPPPADAGSIPADDKMFGGMTVKQRLAAHQRNATCASCHSRIDPLGFPFERYDSTGRWREKYSDGKPIEDSTATADRTEISGVDGLLAYLKKQEPQVMRNMSNKLVGYALGRTILASDQPLIDRMVSAGSTATFSQLAAEIVTSRQFRYRRERDESSSEAIQRSSVTAVPGKSPKDGGL